MQSIPLEPGMRVRCVDVGLHIYITEGARYSIMERSGSRVRVNNGRDTWYAADLFKPIVRVKATTIRFGALSRLPNIFANAH